MDINNILEWSALEYQEKDRSTDWYWALGVITVTSTITAIIFGDYFFAALLLLGGTLLGVFAHKKPRVISYALDEKGLHIGDRLYPYKNIKAFWVQIGLRSDIDVVPTLFIKTERLFMPIISIPIEDAAAEHIHNVMTSQNIPEQEMKEPPAEKIMESLGF